MNIQTVKSAGGIDAWLVEDHAVPMLAVRFAVDGGSTQGPSGKEGVANFVAQMLDQGAGDLTAIAFQERIKDLAARLGFSAGKDAFSGSFTTLSENRDEAVQLLKQALTKPRFDADAVERTRQRLMVAIARSAREPSKLANAEWDAVAFAGHAYARPVLGSAASVGKITADDLEVYRKRVLSRDTLKVVAVGDITPAALGTLLDEVFGELPARADLDPLAQTQPILGGRLAVIEMDLPQSVVAFGMGAIPQHDPAYMAAVVLNNMLGGGGFGSRLMEEVRVKRGLAYSVSTQLASARYASVLRGGVATRNDMVGQSLDIIRRELQAMADGEIGQRALDNAKSYLVGSYPLRFDSNAKIASQLLDLRRDGFGLDYVDNRNALVAAVTLDDLKRVAKRLFNPDDLIVTVVGKPVLQPEMVSGTRIAASAA
jgi:zinc protease